MKSILRPSTIADEAQLIQFLTRAFGAGPDSPFVNPLLLRWKYWDPRPGWRDPRSWVIEKDGRIVAHAGLWPVEIRSGETTGRGVQMIDWASDPHTPGAGVSLLQHLIRGHGFVYSIGGSSATRAILPRFGFHVCAEAVTFARPIRPWRQIIRHQSRNLRLPLRLARNLWWSRSPAAAPCAEWTVTAAATGEEIRPEMIPVGRDGNFVQYLGQCPTARLLSFRIVRKGQEAGYFALAAVGMQARLAGIALQDPAPDNWRIAFQLVQEAALRFSSAAEVVVRTASAVAAQAAAGAGMRMRQRTPVFLFRKGDEAVPPLDFQMWDDDSVFLRGIKEEFLT